MEGAQVDRMETIQECAIPPWKPRLQTTLEPNREKTAEMVNKDMGIMIATSSAVKRGIASMGGQARDTLFQKGQSSSGKLRSDPRDNQRAKPVQGRASASVDASDDASVKLRFTLTGVGPGSLSQSRGI